VLEVKLQVHLPGSALLLPLLRLLELWRLLLCDDFFLPLASTCRHISNNTSSSFNNISQGKVTDSAVRASHVPVPQPTAQSTW
jgi:hypothetical protein